LERNTNNRNIAVRNDMDSIKEFAAMGMDMALVDFRSVAMLSGK
jgi:hypothetical protein